MRTLQALLLATLVAPALLRAADRYEAEAAMVDSNLMVKVADAAASGGFYVNMKDGALAFQVTAATAGYYTLWASYKQAYDAAGKVQNLSDNGASKGQISFPYVAGSSENARKLYGFLREKFGNQVVSGFMTNVAMQNDGKYTPHTLAESKWIHDASGKYPALMGLDFMHATGKASDGEWHQGYTKATLALAEEMFKKGGIPATTSSGYGLPTRPATPWMGTRATNTSTSWDATTTTIRASPTTVPWWPPSRSSRTSSRAASS